MRELSGGADVLMFRFYLDSAHPVLRQLLNFAA
jgi:hypothetical protein